LELNVNRSNDKRKPRKHARENKPAPVARPHIYAEACWFADDPAGCISNQPAREIIRTYDCPRWERLFVALLTKCFDISEKRTVLRFADLLFGYLIVSEFEQARQVEHTLGKYTPSGEHGLERITGLNKAGHNSRKDMPRRKTYWKRARKVFSADARPFGIFPLVSVHSCDAKGRAIAADLKTRVMGTMLNDLLRDGYGKDEAIRMIATTWNIFEEKTIPPASTKEQRQLDSIRRSLLRLPTTKPLK
jgi:hypothetical protein